MLGTLPLPVESIADLRSAAPGAFQTPITEGAALVKAARVRHSLAAHRSGPQRLVEGNDLDARVAATLEMLRGECVEKNIVVTGDDRIAECAVDLLLRYSDGYTKNKREEGGAPPHYPLGAGAGSRISYRLRDLAEWIERKRNAG